MEVVMKKQTIFYVLVGLLTCLCIGMFAYTVNPKLDLNGDNAIYIRLARALADGQGYSFTSTNGQCSPTGIFPPGYSAVLSVLIRLGLDSLMAFKALNGLFLLLSVLGLFLITRRVTGQTYLAFSIAALTMFSGSLLTFTGMAMSEMTYMTATVLAMWMLHMYSNTNREGTMSFYRSPYFYLSIVFAACAYYTRTIGVSILFAVVMFYLFRKEWWASLSAVAGCVLCLLPWSIRNASHGIGERYLVSMMMVNERRPEEGSMSIGGLIERVWNNLCEIVVQGFKALLFPFGEWATTGFWAWFFGLLVVAVVIYGIWNMGKMRWAMLAFLLGNMGMWGLWHGGNGLRYVTPFIPFLFVFFFVGVWAAVQRFIKKRPLTSVKPDSKWGLVFLLLMLPMIKPIQALHAEVRRPYPMAYTHYFNLAQMMQNSMEKGTMVCCRKPELFLYFAPNMSVTNYVYDLNPDGVIRDLVNKKVDYVVLEQLGYASTARYLYPAIQAHPDLFTQIYVSPSPETYLFKFEREAANKKLPPIQAE